MIIFFMNKLETILIPFKEGDGHKFEAFIKKQQKKLLEKKKNSL